LLAPALLNRAQMSQRVIQISFCALWLVAACAGFAFVSRYQASPGSTGATPSQWPQQSAVILDHERPTLLMFAHPKCPCTRASLEELNRLLARSNGRIAAHVVLLQPSTEDAKWSETGLRETAAAIPGVTVHPDRDGQLAQAFGAKTSGFVTLFDSHGQLLFKGGITNSRGHAGDNPGADSIVSFLDGTRTNLSQTPVYGCGLFNFNNCCDSKGVSDLCVK
jgi:hypothetical protein